ncbi:MAG TPA: YdcF family protein [Gemmatimonadales bacterium]|nr:YdcF family protein [Gemmatimonadales bacterium]
MPHALRRTAALVGLTVSAAVVAWAGVAAAVAVAGTEDQAGPVDAIVVLGAAQYNGRPSPVFRARLDHAATLYRAGHAPVILVTGGIGRRDTLSEAAVGARYLASSELPGAAVVALPAGADTYASLAEVGGWFRGRGSRRVLLVSDAFHLLRLRVLAERLALEPYTSPAPASPITANRRRYLAYVAAEGIKVPLTWLFQR